DVTFDESVLFYRLFPYRSTPPPPPPLFLAPGPPPVDPLPPQGPAPSGVSQVDPLSGTAPDQVAVGSGAAPGAASGGAASGGAEPGGAESEGAGSGGAERGGEEPGGAERAGVETKGVEPGGAESVGAESGDAEPQGAASSGAPGAGGARDAEAGSVGVTTGAGGPGGTAATGPGGARTKGTEAARTGGIGGAGAGDPAQPGAAGAGGTSAGGAGAEGAGAARAGAVDPRAGGPGGTVRPRLYFVPLLQQFGGLTERREPASRPVSPVCTARRVPRSNPPPVPGTHAMALRPSSSDRARAASPTVVRLLATTVTDPSFESSAASALVAELLDFAVACRLDYAIALDTQEEFECLAAAVPRFASMLLAPKGDLDAPDIPTPRSYAEAITGPYSSQWQAAMDAEMASRKSTGTYVDEVPPPRANIVDGMWIFRVKLPPGSPPVFKARYVARGFSQQQGVDYFQTFSPTPKMTTLRVLLIEY
ncbi:unnamed protein product, partial [Closterium sp. NIES-54]